MARPPRGRRVGGRLAHEVFIDLPTGQVSWHVHDSELALFDFLPTSDQRCWDGHSTDEKYERLLAWRPQG